MNPRDFFAELKRRNVYKVAVAYAVIAWLLVQAGSILLPTFEAPGWVMKALVTAIAAGFPIALVLSWAFELTPAGLVRSEDVAPNESIPPQTGRKLAGVTIAVTVAALGLFLFQTLRDRSPVSHAGPASRTIASPVDQKSIAVLRFTDLSPGHDQEYFSDGIADEILNSLAKVSDLKVAGRTSSFYFKGRNEDLQTIGGALGVAHVLQGSVRKQGEKVRITAQLIQVRTDSICGRRPTTAILAMSSNYKSTSRGPSPMR